MALAHIKKLEIDNFKSIRKLKLNPKRVNVFIGEPNSGKTNIIEALSFLSIGSVNVFRDIFRFDSVDELFPDSDVSEPITVYTDIISSTFEYHKNQHGALMNNFLWKFYDTQKESDNVLSEYVVEYDGNIRQERGGQFQNNMCFYSFIKLKKFRQNYRDILEPPFGENFPNLLLSNKELRNLVRSIFKERGYRLEIKPSELKVTMVKEDKDGTLYSYPYLSVSETLQRIVFMLLAIESNKNFILFFDEPESNTFPFYTKYIAERIALDKTNQYFFTTHNPYLLMSLIEKTPAKELNVIVTKMKDYKTQCFPLNSKQVERAIKLGHDMFFNIDKLIK